MMYAGAVLAASCVPAYMVASKVLATGGPFLLLTVLPGLYLIFGFALCSACVVSAHIVQPKLSVHRPIEMFSADYARWWTVSLPFLC